MVKNYPEITKHISNGMDKLHQDIPATMESFTALIEAAGQEGALSQKTKELIALAIAVSARCDGCIGFHAKSVIELGATRQEIEEALGVAIYMGGGPSVVYAAEALTAFEQFSKDNA